MANRRDRKTELLIGFVAVDDSSLVTARPSDVARISGLSGNDTLIFRIESVRVPKMLN